ncbi:hypothetical protein BDR05DRAFT_971491 [Suillus weaverae]|nr:hypothetical protein BDR05DRAFT_971491 [Suillus weaverae]
MSVQCMLDPDFVTGRLRAPGNRSECLQYHSRLFSRTQKRRTCHILQDKSYAIPQRAANKGKRGIGRHCAQLKGTNIRCGS